MASATDRETNLSCPHCQRPLRVSPELHGQIVSCLHCGGRIHIPAATVPVIVSFPTLVQSGARRTFSARRKPSSIGPRTAAVVGTTLFMLIVAVVLILQFGQHNSTGLLTNGGDNKSASRSRRAAKSKTKAGATVPKQSRTASLDAGIPAQTVQGAAPSSAQSEPFGGKLSSATSIKLTPIDLFAELQSAGYRIDGMEYPASAGALRQSVIQYLCCGTHAESLAVLQGTSEDRQRAADRRAPVRKQLSDSFTCCLALKNLPVHIVETASAEDPYTVLKATVGLHLSRRSGYGISGADTTSKDGAIEKVVLSRLSPVYWGWRKSDQTLVRLESPEDIILLKASGGAVFQSEAITTELLLIASVPPHLREELNLGTAQLQITVVVDGLKYDNRDEFGCFNHDRLVQTGFDCDAVYADFVTERLEELSGFGSNGTRPPAYFPVAGANDDRILSAFLTAVYLHTHDGQLLGSLTCPQLTIHEVICPVKNTRSTPMLQK